MNSRFSLRNEATKAKEMVGGSQGKAYTPLTLATRRCRLRISAQNTCVVHEGVYELIERVLLRDTVLWQSALRCGHQQVIRVPQLDFQLVQNFDLARNEPYTV